MLEGFAKVFWPPGAGESAHAQLLAGWINWYLWQLRTLPFDGPPASAEFSILAGRLF